MKTPTNKKIAEGIHYCIKNAERFLVSASLLLKNDRFQDSYLLTLYSLEEMGKVILIWNVPFHVETKEKFNKWKKRFKNHEEKFWFSKDLDDAMEQRIPAESNKKEKQKVYIKQGIAYVDMKEDFFVAPKEISKELAAEVLAIAEKRLSFLRERHPSIEHSEERIFEACKKFKNLSLKELRALRSKEIIK